MASAALHPQAQLALGRLYETGEGVAKDEALALSLYLRAAEQNEPRAARAAA